MGRYDRPMKTRDQDRSCRKDGVVRAKSFPIGRRMPLVEGIDHASELTDDELKRPKTRGECVDGPRPCPWVGCRHHLYLDVNEENGSIKLNFPDKEPHELEVSCSLDVADDDCQSLERVGDLINVVRENIRQVEFSVMAQVKSKRHLKLLSPFVEDSRPVPVEPYQRHTRAEKRRMRSSPAFFGYRRRADGCIEPDEREQSVKASIMECHREGLRPKEIADKLNSEGTFYRERQWDSSTIWRMIFG